MYAFYFINTNPQSLADNVNEEQMIETEPHISHYWKKCWEQCHSCKSLLGQGALEKTALSLGAQVFLEKQSG